MNKIINLILSGLLWRRYKFLLITLIVTVVFMLVVGQVHQDYLRYNEMQESPDYVGVSFAIKWAVWACSIGAFLIANHLYNRHKKHQKHEAPNSALSKLLKWKDKGQNMKSSPLPSSNEARSDKNTADPFATIRNKDKLRSYAEVLIDTKKPHK